MQRAMISAQRRDYEKQAVANAGGGGESHGMAGPPHWNRQAWDNFKTQYGIYPYSASELPPSFSGCPDWAYALMGLRRPPVSVG